MPPRPSKLLIKSLPLALITSLTAISTLPWAAVLGVIFFLLLILISIDSAIACIEANLTGMKDIGVKDTRGEAAMLLCGLGFVGGIPFLTGGTSWITGSRSTRS